MPLILTRDLDINSICHLHRLHQCIDLAEIMCRSWRTPEMVFSYMLLCALVQTLRFRSTRWRPSWIYVSKLCHYVKLMSESKSHGRLTPKKSYIIFVLHFGSKVNLSRWCQRPFWIWPSGRKCQQCLEKHWGYVLLNMSIEVKWIIKPYRNCNSRPYYYVSNNKVLQT